MEMVVMDKSLLILDDDAPLRGRLRRAMEVRGLKLRMLELCGME